MTVITMYSAAQFYMQLDSSQIWGEVARSRRLKGGDSGAPTAAALDLPPPLLPRRRRRRPASEARPADGGRRAFLLSSRGDPLAEMHRRPWAYSMEAELARSGGGPMGSRRRCGGWRRRIWGFPPQIGSPSGGRARAPSGGPKRWWALALSILLHRSDWGRPKALA